MNVNGFNSKNAALKYLASKGYRMAGALAAPDGNPKLAKGLKYGILSAPMHLAPAKLSGYEVCPMRSAGCTAACLHTAGQPAHMPGKTASRVTKTRAYFEERPAFLAVVAFQIAALERRAGKEGKICGVRLNATSDIPWERVPVTIDGVEYSNFMAAFPDVQFYDYTKIKKRALAAARGRDNWPENYQLTFSKAEDNDSDCGDVLFAGGNVAAVFSADIIKGLAERRAAGVAANWCIGGTWADTIDGDEHDYRPLDPQGVIVALKAKGDARGDESGFVIR